MDLVTHSLVGVALSRAGFRRISRQSTLLLILGATLPDIDILSLAGGQLADFKYHRGYTHGFLMLPILALVCVGLTAVIGTEKLHFFKAWLTASAGVGSHLLLDWTSSFGIRPLLPFSSTWFYLDLNAFYDGVILSALLLAFAWPRFVDLVAGEIGGRSKHKGQGSALAVLLFLLLYDFGRWSLHTRALNELGSRMYNEQVPLDVSALPEPNNPFEWIGIVETEEAFRIVKTGSLDIGNASDARVFIKPQMNAGYRAVMQTEPFRYMAYFARFPVWGEEPLVLGAGFGKVFDLTDLRFGTPGRGSFHASAITDGSGHVLVSEFGFSTAELDRMRANADGGLAAR